MESRLFVSLIATLAQPKPAVYFAGDVQGVDGMVSLILTLLSLWYLLKNVRRLAAEPQAAPSEPPPTGA